MDNNNSDDLDLYEDDVVEIIDENNGLINDDDDDMFDVNDDDTAEDDYGAAANVDNSIRTFSKHEDSVFCISLDPVSNDIAATGGQDDRAYVWRISSGETLFECTGHKESVTSVAFSHDGTYVATGDLGGFIQVWKVSTKESVWSFEGSDVEWLRWHPSANVLFSGTVDGDWWMWKIPGNECKTFQSFGSGAANSKMFPDGKRMLVGYDDGAIREWDMKNGSVLHTYSGNDGHNSNVVSLDCHNDNSVFISGSTDVTAKIWNSTSGKLLSTFRCRTKDNDRKEDEDSVETVAFSPVLTCAATGTLTGSLYIWDIPSQSERTYCQHHGGVVKISWDKESPLLYTCSLDGLIRLWDARNGQQVSQWSGHAAEVLDFQITRDGSHIVSVSEDRTAKVFSLHTPER